jgi:hypothetical protein
MNPPQIDEETYFLYFTGFECQGLTSTKRAATRAVSHGIGCDVTICEEPHGTPDKSEASIL